MVLEFDFISDLRLIYKALKMMMGLQTKPRLRIFYKKSSHALKKIIHNLYVKRLVSGDDEAYKKKKKKLKKISRKEKTLIKKVIKELKTISEYEKDSNKALTLYSYADTLELCLKTIDSK